MLFILWVVLVQRLEERCGLVDERRKHPPVPRPSTQRSKPRGVLFGESELSHLLLPPVKQQVSVANAAAATESGTIGNVF